MSLPNTPDAASRPFCVDHDIAAQQAVIDIGSNSIRLVIWQDGGRAPPVMFNEKTMAGLGREVAATGLLSDAAMDLAERALSRFAALTRTLDPARVHVVATAAVRQAENGSEFVHRILKKTGLEIQVLTGEEEAVASASGVIAAIPEADGIVGDLGGGSLELVRVAGRKVCGRVSLPFGSLGVAAIRQRGPRALERAVEKALRDYDWVKQGKELPFYAVGGSWRALSQVHMDLHDHPLPMVHQYQLPAKALPNFARALASMSARRLKAIPNLSSSRIQTLPGAVAVLSEVTRQLCSDHVVISAWGLREGILYQRLSDIIQAEDPLISAARREGDREGRFPGQGDLLADWIAPLFESDPADCARLRHAACLLGDVAWRAHPDFRPDRGLEFALHGNWVGVDARGRALMGAALFANFGGPAYHEAHSLLRSLASEEDLCRAQLWGLAIRLGIRLTGGRATELSDIALRHEGMELILEVPAAKAALYSDTIQRRHKALAVAMGVEPIFKVIAD